MTHINHEGANAGETPWDAPFLARFGLRLARANCPPHLAKIICAEEPNHFTQYPKTGEFIEEVIGEDGFVFYEGLSALRFIETYELRREMAMASWGSPYYFARALSIWQEPIEWGR